MLLLVRFERIGYVVGDVKVDTFGKITIENPNLGKFQNPLKRWLDDSMLAGLAGLAGLGQAGWAGLVDRGWPSDCMDCDFMRFRSFKGSGVRSSKPQFAIELEFLHSLLFQNVCSWAAHPQFFGPLHKRGGFCPLTN